MALSEEQASKLSEFNIVLVGDKSGSMGEKDGGSRSRWQSMEETFVAFARDACEVDSDGIGLVLFGGSDIQAQDNCNVDKVKQMFGGTKPGGSTPLAEALTAALGLVKKSEKKALIVVFTDGVPDDKKAAADVIRKQSNSQATDEQCTFLFVQVGKEPSAAEYLRKLDDDLTGCKFDIVDAKTMDEVEKYASTGELLLDAITD